MTDREKLVGMLIEADREIGILCDGCGSRPEQEVFGNIADHLIAHGVTVREMQKPLAVEELGKGQRDFIWIEHDTAYIVPIQILYVGAGLVEYVQFGETGICYAGTDGYGKTWRCWAEKPTEEERKAAEWER